MKHALFYVLIIVIQFILKAEMGFLAEYVAVMKPVAMTFNILQGASSVHMRYLLPTLYQLQDQLKKLISSCTVWVPVIDALWNGTQKCFAEMTNGPEFNCCSCTST
ncbi:hypothetical protein GOODEAATRI_033711 [Goodea atripinnis]|uniref:Secreted protein n=1 Tax=Goodea atripinnis TaxID=208336 RepID=A0ABV0Q369_9TELE